MANLPLPKLNEVYYWEVKMYEKPPNTEVAVGLATKPYPSFRLPGWNKHSVAYFASDGFKSHDYHFTASSHGPPLALDTDPGRARSSSRGMEGRWMTHTPDCSGSTFSPR